MENNTLANRWFHELWNGLRLETAYEIMSTVIVYHIELEEIKGINNWKRKLYDPLPEAIPDIYIEVEDIIAKGEHLAVRWNARGVFNAELYGVRPSVKMLKFSGVSWARIVNNKMVEVWTNWNMSFLLGQLFTEIKTFKKLLPVCCVCGLVLDDNGVEEGEWITVDEFVSQKTGAKVSHSYCPKCGNEAMAKIKGFDKREC